MSPSSGPATKKRKVYDNKTLQVIIMEHVDTHFEHIYFYSYI